MSEAADVKIHKLLTMHRGFQVQRLYNSQKESGRGLVSIKATILDETQNIQEYISKMAPKTSCSGMSEVTAERPTNQPEEMPWHSKALHGMYHR